MKWNYKLIVIYLIIVISLFTIFPKRTYAYLDPGSGSLIFQIIIGGLIGGLFGIKMFWKNIKSFFLKLFGGNDNG